MGLLLGCGLPGNRASKFCWGQSPRKWLHFLKFLSWVWSSNHRYPNSPPNSWALSPLVHARPYLYTRSPTLLSPQPPGKVGCSQGPTFETHSERPAGQPRKVLKLQILETRVRTIEVRICKTSSKSKFRGRLKELPFPELRAFHWCPRPSSWAGRVLRACMLSRQLPKGPFVPWDSITHI